MNEAILMGTAVLDIGLVYFGSLFGRIWLYISIVINLRLIILLGAKLVPIFGFVTNSGNAFYTAVVFAMLLLLEHGKTRDAGRAIIMAIVAIVAFTILGNLTLMMTSAPETQQLSQMMREVASVTIRIAAASLVGFTLSQLFALLIYHQWQEELGTLGWWVRVIGVVLAVQVIDSLFFFSVAFFGRVPTAETFQILIVGLVIKIVIGICATPLLYASHYMKPRQISQSYT